MAKSRSAYSVPGKIGKIERHIIVVWVDNEAGVLARIAGLFSGRGYNIESLAVAEVDAKRNISRITIVTTGPPQVIDQIKLQLKKLVPVHKVADFKRDDKGVIFKEMALFKFVGNTNKIKKAVKHKIDTYISPRVIDIFPDAIGLLLVLSTRISYFLSRISLTMQPADLISIEPKKKYVE